MADLGQQVRAILERRRDVLEYLSTGTRSQAEIAAALDISRATVTRAMDELQGYDLVRRTYGEYETTRLGETLLQGHDRYRDVVDSVLESGSIIEHVPSGAPFEPEILVDGTAYRVEPGASFQVRERVNDEFRDAVAIKGLAQTRSERESAEINFQKVLEEERAVAFVMSPALFEHVRTLEWGPSFLAAENLDVAIHDAVPYGLFVIEQPDERVMVLVVYDEDFAMKGIVRSTAPRSIAWAEAVYDSYLASAVPMDAYVERGAD